MKSLQLFRLLCFESSLQCLQITGSAHAGKVFSNAQSILRRNDLGLLAGRTWWRVVTQCILTHGVAGELLQCAAQVFRQFWRAAQVLVFFLP